jgi:hypothetical protein
MEPGYTIDNAYGSKTLPEWVAGEPVSSLAARTSCRSSPIVAADADISKATATAADGRLLTLLLPNCFSTAAFTSLRPRNRFL